MGMAVAALGIVLLWRSIGQPAVDYDALMYHLPLLAEWFQHHTFTVLAQFDVAAVAPGEDVSTTWQVLTGRFPFTWEALRLLFVLPFGEAFAAAVPNLAAWVLLGLAVYRLSVTLGAQRVHGLAAAALLLTVPLIVWHMSSQPVELPLASLFLAGLYLFADYARTRAAVSLALALATTGMLLGVKTSAAAYVACLVAYGIGSVWLVPPANGGEGRRLAPAAGSN